MCECVCGHVYDHFRTSPRYVCVCMSICGGDVCGSVYKYVCG